MAARKQIFFIAGNRNYLAAIVFYFDAAYGFAQVTCSIVGF